MVVATNLRLVRQVMREILLIADPYVKAPVIHYENRHFTPPNPPDVYVKETMQPAPERMPSFGLIESRGLTRYDVFTPEGSGTEKAEDIAMNIATVFQPSTGKTSQGVTLAFDRAERKQGRKVDSAWWMIPVVITWRTYTKTI